MWLKFSQFVMSIVQHQYCLLLGNNDGDVACSIYSQLTWMKTTCLWFNIWDVEVLLHSRMFRFISFDILQNVYDLFIYFSPL